MLNVFREDPGYAQHEAQYKAIAKELLGDESEQEEEEQGGPGGRGVSVRMYQYWCPAHALQHMLCKAVLWCLL